MSLKPAPTLMYFVEKRLWIEVIEDVYFHVAAFKHTAPIAASKKPQIE